MTNRVPSETRQHEHEEARIYTGENEIYSNKRSVFSQLFLWLVIIGCVVTLVVTTGCHQKSSQTAPIVVDAPLDSSLEPVAMFKPIENEELDKKIAQILEWIKTKKPEWDTDWTDLTIYLQAKIVNAV